MTAERTTTDDIRTALESDGWTLSHTWKDTGGYQKQSVAEITITRGRQSYTTEYTQGWGMRKWISRFYMKWSGTGYWDQEFKRGKRVEVIGMKQLKIDSPYNVKFIAEFAAITEPETPTLDAVLYALHSDAGGVRHGQTFEDWAGDFGCDTDSRKAEKCFNACRETWAALVRLGADFDKLDNLFQDY